MPLSEIEYRRLQKIIRGFIEKRRPAPHIRPKLDLGFRVDKQSIELFERRPNYIKSEEYREFSFAKALFVQSRKVWKVFWKRADLKWHAYQPNPTVKTVEVFLDLVDRDEHGCFFG